MTETVAPVFDVQEMLRKRMQALGVDVSELPVMQQLPTTNVSVSVFDALTARPLEQTTTITSGVTGIVGGQSMDATQRIVTVMRYNWHPL